MNKRSPNSAQPQENRFFRAAARMAGMRWGAVYTLLVVGGAGIVAADMAVEYAVSRMTGGSAYQNDDEDD